MKIAFIGPDGSGKSSLIDFSRKRLEEEGRRVDVIFMGWRDFKNPLLKLFSKIYMSGKKGEGAEGEREEKLARFRERGWGFYFIYYIELWGRYFRALGKRSDFIFFDRYFFDELAFSSKGKFRLLSLFTPRPDLCFILKVGRKVAKDRGVEVSAENFDKFYRHLGRVEQLCKVVEIDSSGAVEDSYSNIAKYL